MFFYWLNPVLFYISYIHGQLDVVSTAFCFFSLYCLTRKKEIFSAFLMSAAILCKSYVIAVVPLVVVYLWGRWFSKEGFKRISIWLAICGSISFLGFIPLIISKQFFYVTTASPEAFRLFSAQVSYGQNQILYLGILLVLVVLGRLCLATKITDQGLILGAGTIFGTMLFVTDSMPGWYFWFIPFVSLFFVSCLNMPRFSFWAMISCYFLYFIGSRSFGGPLESLWSGIAFTTLQASLLGVLLGMWMLSVRREVCIERRTKPMVFGLCGDSGSGKNHLSELIATLFNPKSTLFLEGDDYHRWERGHKQWQSYTHLSPYANQLDSLSQHIYLLAQGVSVQKSHYDHETGQFTLPRELKPAKTVIIQGLHTFYLLGMRKKFDLKIFLSPDPLIRFYQKLKRDVNKRGYTVENVLASISQRENDSKNYIEPQKDCADWILEAYLIESMTAEEIINGRVPRIGNRHIFWNDAPISDLIYVLQQFDHLFVKVNYLGEGISRLAVEIEGHINQKQVTAVAEQVFPNLRVITRGWSPPVWREGYDGINQLITLSLLNQLN